jgi:hypothetical protein
MMKNIEAVIIKGSATLASGTPTRLERGSADVTTHLELLCIRVKKSKTKAIPVTDSGGL